QFIFRKSFNFGVAYALVGTVLVVLVGHTQAQHMVAAQPMKMAAAEAHWNTENPAAISVFTIGDEEKREDVFAIKIPGMLSFLAYNSFDGEVKGINDIQKEYEAKYGPGDYVPPVAISYWSFRIMVGSGMLMLLLVGFAAFLVVKKRVEQSSRFLRILPWAIALPFIANTTGWLFTEVARQPWIVFGLQRTEDGISKSVTAGEILFSLIVFTLLYTVILIAALKLFTYYAKRGVEETKKDETDETDDEGGSLLDEDTAIENAKA
ncbi:MAG: cytochrome ubiquinol oxidase subunit I, partial [Myxococcota bacterium]|nr:cytochrome ubiquinol oxidase subunit I [Myxococcota bacterium]